MAIGSELSELLIYANTDRVPVSALIISHSDIPAPFYLTDHFPNFMGVDPNGDTQFFEYVPMRVDDANKEIDLAYERGITIQDLNESIRPVIDQIPLDTTELISVTVLTYVVREDGSVSPIEDGPYYLETEGVAFSNRGASFVASAKQTNNVGSGEKGSVTRVPFYLQYL